MLTIWRVRKLFTACDPYFAILFEKHILRHVFVLLNLNVDGFCTAKPECGWMEGTLQWSANQTSKQLLQSSEMGLLGVLLPAVCCFFLIQVVFGAYQCKSVPVKFCSHLFWLLWWWISFPYDPLWSSTLIGQYWIEVVKFACSIKHLAWKPDSSVEKELSGQLSNCKNCNVHVFDAPVPGKHSIYLLGCFNSQWNDEILV